MDEVITYTTGNNVPDVDKALKRTKTWKPTPEEKEAHERIKKRYEQEMLPAQQPFHKEWDDAKSIYEAVITPDPLKESFRVPLSHMVIDAALAEEIDAFPDIMIDSQEPEDEQKLPLLNAAKKYALGRANWDRVKMDALRIRRVYGWCAMRIGYKRETRIIKERVPVKGDNGIKLGAREVIDHPVDDIVFEVIDNPRRFLVGPECRDLNDAIDCIQITDVNWEVFKQKVQNDARFKNLDFVKPGSYTGDDVEGALVEPEQKSTEPHNTNVRILEYWNKYRDEYVMEANEVIIRQTCLVDDHKELPFAVLHMHRRPHSFYSKGIPKLIESLEAPYNAVMQAEVRATKLAFPILVTDEDSAIDPRQVAPYPGVVLPGGKDTTDLLQLGTVPSEVYRLKDKLEELIIWITGVNFKQIFGEQSERVGIEALKKESMLARVNANLRENESNFIVRLGDLLVQNIMQYYPVPLIRRLMPSENTDKLPAGQELVDRDGEKAILQIRKIPIEGAQLEEHANEDKGIFTLKRNRETGNSFILARPEYIRTHSKLDVRAVRPSAMGSSKEAKKLMFIELSDHAMAVNQSVVGEPDPETGQVSGEPIWDMEYLQEKVAEAHELPVDKVILSKQQSDQPDAIGDVESIGAQMNELFSTGVDFQQQGVVDQAGDPVGLQDQAQFLNPQSNGQSK